ncbi:septum formation protein [Clonorchis sinensis]|uniref:Septum formation protein n=1 Tax=Clonorchis sinensis TaxID=79923 RepID=G7YXJ9_CLOSI|nr:septum formation protein [Clonorchis sinensis]
MRQTLEGLQNPGVQIACKENLVDLEYADDVVLIFEEEEKAQVFLDELTTVTPSFDMHFAPEKWAKHIPNCAPELSGLFKVVYIPKGSVARGAMLSLYSLSVSECPWRISIPKVLEADEEDSINTSISKFNRKNDRGHSCLTSLNFVISGSFTVDAYASTREENHRQWTDIISCKSHVLVVLFVSFTDYLGRWSEYLRFGGGNRYNWCVMQAYKGCSDLPSPDGNVIFRETTGTDTAAKDKITEHPYATPTTMVFIRRLHTLFEDDDDCRCATFCTNWGESNPRLQMTAVSGVHLTGVTQTKLRRNKLSYQKYDIIVSADTVVVFEGKIFGKPSSSEDAINTLSKLSGKTHSVITGVCLRVRKPSSGDSFITFHEVTTVKMARLERCVIEAYVNSGEPLEKILVVAASAPPDKAKEFVVADHRYGYIHGYTPQDA